MLHTLALLKFYILVFGNSIMFNKINFSLGKAKSMFLHNSYEQMTCRLVDTNKYGLRVIVGM